MCNKMIKDMGELFPFLVVGALCNYFCNVFQKYRCQSQYVWQSSVLSTIHCSY